MAGGAVVPSVRQVDILGLATKAQVCGAGSHRSGLAQIGTEERRHTPEIDMYVPHSEQLLAAASAVHSAQAAVKAQWLAAVQVAEDADGLQPHEVHLTHGGRMRMAAA